MKQAKYPTHSGYTGRIFEEEVLGRCKVRMYGKLRRYSRMLRTDLVLQVIHNQPYNPRRPTGEAGTFHKAVMDKLGCKPGELKLFTAIGSPLDRLHGIDGFFTFEGLTVTVDVTMNPHKAIQDITHVDVPVTKLDAEHGFELAANEIAYWFKYRRSLGRGNWKPILASCVVP